MRAAARLVKLAQRFRSRIVMRFGAQAADARSILGLMLLCATLGATFDVEVIGEDEHEAVHAVQAYFDGGGDEFDGGVPG